MKLYHFIIIFSILAISLFVVADMKTNNYIVITKEKEKLDQYFNQAIDSAVENLIDTEGVERFTVNKERAVNDYFYSLYSSMDLTDNVEKQDELKMYVPVIAVTCEEGYYIYYSDNYKGNDTGIYYTKRWSELMPYTFEDNDFIYSFTLTDKLTIYDKNGLLDPSKEQIVFTINFNDLSTSDEYIFFRSKRPDSFLLNTEAYYLKRKTSIIKCIEKTMSYYCNKHNEIAHHFGISYNFAMPITNNTDWSRSIDEPSIIVLFQGYPYSMGVKDTYNRFVFAGSRVNKDKLFYLEQKDWYLIYHNNNCSELKKEGIILLDETYYSILDCVSKGAYACEICNSDSGAHAPIYSY